MWDERYSRDGYLFGTEPAAFLVDHVDLLTKGARALVVADGEGRNSVFVAEQGLDVVAMDASEVGVAKARALALERNVSVDFRIGDIMAWEWEPDAFDVVIGIFIQFVAPPDRPQVFAGMERTIAPGGRLLLHGYRPEQLAYKTGGPPVAENMYTESLLATAFPTLSTEELRAYDREITEGTGHLGMSALIDYVGRKG